MLFQLPASALLLALAVVTEASSLHGAHSAHLAHLRRRPLNPRGEQPLVPSKRLNKRSSCKAPKSSSTLSASSTKAASKTTSVAANAGSDPKTSTKAAATPTSSASDSTATNAIAAGDFTPTKPSDWPTATQHGDVPTSTVASSSDPYLEELSKGIDYSSYDVFTQVHSGDMTYYGQGLGACGDVYDDNSFTAAVSHLMFDAWLGADPSAQNRNPICGPFVPGRQALNSEGVMATAIKSSIGGYAEIGGDGLINCVGSTDARCHVPMTATVTHGGKSIQVAIVDRCAACKEGDIDLTPAAFAALADMSLGRTDVQWQFNNWY
uniref:RlpA-like protein double-psi beta-barrel domain-containing protein n=1 Tax=Mycena chlorophos TaxID=658473 RepID=A0ABQ0LKX4_MYCCL|nr:predicted protein [Mycena chlorophos]